MAERCDQCRTRLRGEGNRTTTRVLCDSCYARFAGASAGVIAGGGVSEAIATAGWNERTRAARDKK